MVDLELQGKVALVTGAGIGIGRAIARALAAQGCIVALNDISQPDIAAAAAEIAAAGGRAVPAPADVSRKAEVEAMVQEVVDRCGGLDILVSGAGWTPTRPALEWTEEDVDRCTAVMLKGLFFCCQAAGGVMVAQRSGHIVNIGSQLGVVATQNRSIYSAVKAGVHQLTRSLALEWAPYGVHVNCVAPCLTETPTRKALLADPAFAQKALSMLPAGRWAQPEDVVGCVLFLCSPMAEMVTGHTLLVDGGWTLH